MTFDEILNRMLARVPNTFDKRQGSVIYDALAPAAKEMEIMYQEILDARADTFAGTADREYLIKRCAEIGVTPFEATYAIRKGIFTPSDLEIQIGERFDFGTLNFVVTEKLDDGVYALQCETLGEIGNFGTGNLIPINYIEGLATATLSEEVLIYGEEEEETEALRQRYFDTLPTMTLDGNVNQYSKWCSEYAGIGSFKIFPEWNGKNTVKVSILSSENTIASQTLIEDFQTYLDPVDETINDDLTIENYPQGRGVGMGKAPIGAIVTVSTATEKDINIEAVVVYREGYDSPVGLEEEIAEYLQSVNYNKSIVSYTAIAALLQTNVAIELVIDFTLNGDKVNLTLDEEEIAKLNTYNIVGE